MPIMVPTVNPTGILRYEIIGRDGVTRDFTRETSPKRFIPAGSIGFGTAEYSIQENKLPVNPGTFLRTINTGPRTMSIPIVITEPSFAYLIAAMEDLHDWFNTGDEHSKAPLYLRVTRPDNTIRQIAGYYVNGLAGDMNEGSPTFVKYVVDLHCPDPAPTDPTNTVVTKTVAQAAAFGGFGIINQGRINAYPIWKLTGPFTNVDILNITTGEGISVIITIPAGRYLTIDTRPADVRNTVSVYDDLGVNKTPNVFPTSKFWQLIPGQNNISVIFTSGTTVATTVQLTYLAKYRSLLR